MLDINLSFLWVAVNLLVLYLFLRKFLFQRVGNFMDQRSKKIEDDIESAAKMRELTETERKSIAGELAKAREESQQLLEEARELAARQGEEIVGEARREAARLLGRAREQAEQEREQIYAQLRREIASISVMAAGKVLAENLDSERNRALVDEFLRKQSEGAA